VHRSGTSGVPALLWAGTGKVLFATDGKELNSLSDDGCCERQFIPVHIGKALVTSPDIQFKAVGSEGEHLFNTPDLLEIEGFVHALVPAAPEDDPVVCYDQVVPGFTHVLITARECPDQQFVMIEQAAAVLVDMNRIDPVTEIFPVRPDMKIRLTLCLVYQLLAMGTIRGIGTYSGPAERTIHGILHIQPELLKGDLYTTHDAG
jgi:hypothetical protein